MKRPFTLMEVLIGFVLAALLLGTLFTSLFETSMLSSRLEKGGKDILQRAEIQQRLDRIFSQIFWGSMQQSYPSLYTTKDDHEHITLHVQFQNEVDPDPCFSGVLWSEILVQNQNLLFILKGNPSSEEEEPLSRQEILKEGVRQVTYEFLSFQDSERPLPHTWEPDTPHILSYLKMTLHLENNQTTSYAFWVKHEPSGVPLL